LGRRGWRHGARCVTRSKLIDASAIVCELEPLPVFLVPAMTDLKLQAQIDELFLLQRVAQRISALLDIEVLLEEVVGDVSQTFGYSRSAVLLKDELTENW
jgi:hypothetical protein